MRLLVAVTLLFAALAREARAQGPAPASRLRNEYTAAAAMYARGDLEGAAALARSIFDSGCMSDGVARDAWLLARQIAVDHADDETVERLATELVTRECTFGEAPVDCTAPGSASSPACVTTDCGFTPSAALRTYQAAEEERDPRRARRLFEQAARQLLVIAREAPDGPEALLALEHTAGALERAQLPRAAADIYREVADHIASAPARPDHGPTSDMILANASFREGYAAFHAVDLERALEAYQRLYDDRRLARSTIPRVRELRTDALVNAALIHEWLDEPRLAIPLLRRAARETDDATLVEQIHERIARLRRPESAPASGERMPVLAPPPLAH